MFGGTLAGAFVDTVCTEACCAAVILRRRKKANTGPVIRKACMTIGRWYQNLPNKRGVNRVGKGDGMGWQKKYLNPTPARKRRKPATYLIVSVYDRSGIVRTTGNWSYSPGGRVALRTSVLKNVPALPEIQHSLAAVFRRTQSVRGPREHHVVSQLRIGPWLQNIASA